MWTRSSVCTGIAAFFLAMLLVLLLQRAFADGISSPLVSKGGGVIGLDQGINNLAVGGTSGGGGGCSGTIDLSTGCVQPMLGVL